jgi:hypothetical protein
VGGELLAGLIREETGVGAEDIRPWVAANTIIGVHRALVEHVRRRSLAGTPNRRLAREVRQLGEQALAALARGLGDLSDWTPRVRLAPNPEVRTPHVIRRADLLRNPGIRTVRFQGEPYGARMSFLIAHHGTELHRHRLRRPSSSTPAARCSQPATSRSRLVPPRTASAPPRPRAWQPPFDR